MSEVGKINYEQSTSMVYTAIGLRDQMAMAAMQGLIASGQCDHEKITKLSYAMATLMLAERDNDE